MATRRSDPKAARLKPGYVLKAEDVVEFPMTDEDRAGHGARGELFNRGEFWESHEAWDDGVKDAVDRGQAEIDRVGAAGIEKFDRALLCKIVFDPAGQKGILTGGYAPPELARVGIEPECSPTLENLTRPRYKRGGGHFSNWRMTCG